MVLFSLSVSVLFLIKENKFERYYTIQLEIIVELSRIFEFEFDNLNLFNIVNLIKPYRTKIVTSRQHPYIHERTHITWSVLIQGVRLTT